MLHIKPDPHLILLLIVTKTSAEFYEEPFTAVDDLANKVYPVERRLSEFEARSAIGCMTKASQHSDCAGVGYHGNSKMCYVCDTYQDTTGTFPTLTGTKFYQRSNAPSAFNNVAGYNLKFVYDPPSSYTTAESACAAEGGALVRIDSIAKKDAIISFLLDPANGAAVVDLWIQLKYDSVDGRFEFDDGTPVPMTTDYWNPTQPDQNEPCGQMMRHFIYKWDDTVCHVGKGYICEI